MSSEPVPVENPLLVIERFGYVLALALTGLAGVLWGRGALVAAGTGGAIACSNLWLMRRLLDRALREAATTGAEDATRRLLAALAVKTPIYAALIYLAVVTWGLEPGPFALGLSSFVLALIFGGLYVGHRDRDD